MSSPASLAAQDAKAILHEGWIEHKIGNDNRWSRSWIMLLDSTLYFLNTPNKSQETPTGMLYIERDLKFEKKDGSEKMGYKFEIIMNRKLYKFKTTKFSEREQWRAYLEGVATGQVSSSIDLLPEHLDQIRQALQRHQARDELDFAAMVESLRHDVPTVGGAHLTSDADSGCVDLFLDTGNADTQPILSPNSMNLSPSSMQGHVFHLEQVPHVPSWFFNNKCSRDLAMEILTRGAKYGNTLMRKGTSNNLVISKKMETGREKFTHYEVTTDVSGGYKLKVENPHQPMRTLTEVMDFFVQTSGPLSTKPMTCNNLQQLGLSPEHDYNPFIVQTISSASQKNSPVDRRNAASSTNASQSMVNLSSQSSIGAPSYINLQSANKKAVVFSKTRSPSVPDINPHTMADNRKMSAGCISPEARPRVFTSGNATARSTNVSQPPPPQAPPPPLNPPPPLPKDTQSKLKVRISPHSQSFDQAPSPPPELPPNHPPPLRKSPRGGPKSPETIAGFSGLAKLRRAPPVSNTPARKSEGDHPKHEFEFQSEGNPTQNMSVGSPRSSRQRSIKEIIQEFQNQPAEPEPPQSGKKLGEMSKEDFIKKLEATFANGKAKTFTAMRHGSSSRPDAAAVVSPLDFATYDEMYDSIDGYLQPLAPKDIVSKR